MRRTCARHLDDLAKEKSPGFAYRFDPQKAFRACLFIEQLPHIKGQWARSAAGKAQKIKLEPFQVFIVCAIFGWIVKATGLRRFSEAYIKLPRKNTKSTLAAAIGLYMQLADGEYGAEVYSGATSEKQAWEVFRPALRMVLRTPELTTYFGVEATPKSKQLVRYEDGSRFEPVIGDPGDGASPSCAIVDEFHEHPNANLYDTMKTGMGARQQPLLLVITTAGSNTAGPCYTLERHVEKVLDGLIEDPALFAYMAGIDEGDDWRSEEALVKANPSFGVSVYREFLLKQQRDAIAQSAKQNIFKTKHLNIWTNAATAWINMEAWRACGDRSLKIEEFLGKECYEGDDLSAKINLTARALVFPVAKSDGIHYYVFGRYYLPQDRAMDEKHQHFQQWAHDGLLTTIPGPEIKFGPIRADILADCKRFNMRRIAFDPWGAQQLQTELADELPKDTVVTVPQQTRHLSEPMKEIEAAVIARRLHHDGDPVLAWGISNVVAKPDANGNLFPRKESEDDNIDPATALINGIAHAMLSKPSKRSVYSTRGLLTA